MAETTGSSSTRPRATRLLVAGMTRLDGHLYVRELGAVAEHCGFSGEQVRSCLRRMVAQGVYERVRAGRDALYRTTEKGQQLLSDSRHRLRRALAQDAGGAPWDGEWHLVAFAIPETRRDTRDALREHVLARGGAALQGGLYVSPHAWEESLRDAAKQLSIEAFVSFASTRTLEIGGVGEPRAIAANLWSIDALAFEYGHFVESFRDVPRSLEELLRNGGSVADAQVVPGALYMAEAWTACSTRDPLLPPELLPRPWPGRTARDVLLRSRRLALSARRDRGALTLFATSFGEATASQSVDNATKGDRS